LDLFTSANLGCRMSDFGCRIRMWREGAGSIRRRFTIILLITTHPGRILRVCPDVFHMRLMILRLLVWNCGFDHQPLVAESEDRQPNVRLRGARAWAGPSGLSMR